MAKPHPYWYQLPWWRWRMKNIFSPIPLF
jgi:hypothetical protein